MYVEFKKIYLNAVWSDHKISNDLLHNIFLLTFSIGGIFTRMTIFIFYSYQNCSIIYT